MLGAVEIASLNKLFAKCGIGQFYLKVSEFHVAVRNVVRISVTIATLPSRTQI
jgi:hypothetical protein